MAELRVLPPAKKIEYVEIEEGVPEVVVVIMAGTRENFYDELKRYWV